MPRALPWALLLALALALVPAFAAAQVPGAPAPGRTQLTLFLLDPGAGFPPGGNMSLQIGGAYQFPAGSAPQPNPSPEYSENTTPTEIRFSAKALPSWVVSAEFVPPVVLVKVPLAKQAQGGTESFSANVTLSVKPDAPALNREDIVVAAEASANGNLAAAQGESPPLKIRVAPVGKLNVTSETDAIVAGGRWSTVVYQVRNEGNSEIVAKLNVTVKPENSEVEFPKTITLAPGATAPVEVRVRTPWTNAELGTLTLEAVPILEAEEGKVASFDVNVRGESAVPFLGGPLLVGALLVALGLRRR